MSSGNNKAASTATAVREKGLAALKVVAQRRYILFCGAGILCVAALLWLLWPLIPHKAKPDHYRVGELRIQAMTEAVGYRKVTSVSQSMSGVGRAQAGTYTYQAGKSPREDVETYYALLMREYNAQMTEDSEIGEERGTLLLTMPGTQEDREIRMEIVYNPESYTVTVEEKAVLQERPNQPDLTVNVTPEQAKELVMTLTKAETGLKSDISVYTTNQEPETAQVGGWDYYVFTVVADYSATRIEYRATFYVGCYDGVILNYDKETGVTSRLRGPGGAVE